MTSVENGASPAENLLLLKMLRFVGIFPQRWKGIRGLALALLELCIGTLTSKGCPKKGTNRKKIITKIEHCVAKFCHAHDLRELDPA